MSKFLTNNLVCTIHHPQCVRACTHTQRRTQAHKNMVSILDSSTLIKCLWHWLVLIRKYIISTLLGKEKIKMSLNNFIYNQKCALGG